MSSAGTEDRELLRGRYRLVEPLARGGMGTVWRGRDELLGRPIAVKEVRLPPGLDDEERAVLRQRTLREARAAARLNHPAAVTVYDVVEEQDRPWIVMELLPSRSLADVIRDEGPLPPARVAAYGLILLDALEAAHDVGVLHRDVKPANVLLVDDGRVVLTDFGIASVEGDPSLTTTGFVVGSPAYVAPERARGVPPAPAADLWSLGATLYAAVDGRSPFQRADTLSTLTAILTEDPAPSPRLGALGPVVEGLLVKDPRDRLDARTTRVMLAEAVWRREPARRAEPPPPTRSPAFPAEQPGERTPPTSEPSVAPDLEVSKARPERRRRSGVVAGLLLIAALIAAGLGALALVRDDPPGQPAAVDPVDPGTDSGSAASSAPATASPPSTAESSSTANPETGAAQGASPPVQQAAQIPPGFTLHEDETGFSVAVPAGWEPVRSGPRVDFREPGGGRFLRIDQTDDPKPDPLLDWQEQERAVSQRLSNYELVRLDPVDYRGWPAADWEFTYDARSGRQQHVLNRNVVTGDRAYALYWSTPESQWDQSQDIFQIAAQTFQPAE